MSGQWSDAKRMFVHAYIANGFEDVKGAAKRAGISAGLGESWLRDKRVAAHVEEARVAIAGAVDAAHARAADLAGETGLPVTSTVRVTVRAPGKSIFSMSRAELKAEARKRRAEMAKLRGPTET